MTLYFRTVWETGVCKYNVLYSVRNEMDLFSRKHDFYLAQEIYTLYFLIFFLGQSATMNVLLQNASTDLTFCHNQSTPNDYSSESIVYWLEGVLLTFIGFLGVFGNILTILVLKKLGKLQSNVFNQVLITFVFWWKF